MIPLLDPLTDQLCNLQFISDTGSKKYLTGGRVKGCCFFIGEPGEVVCIAEGFATGASVHEATGHAVAIAFDCGNLLPVATAMHTLFPSARIVIAADDDYRTAGNPGLTKAHNAAAAIGGLIAVPDFGADRPDNGKDFNDLAAHGGLDAVRNCIAKAKPIENDLQSTASTTAPKTRESERRQAIPARPAGEHCRSRRVLAMQ